MRLFNLFLLLFFWSTCSLVAQIIVPDSCHVETTDYFETQENDPVYFFPEEVSGTDIMADTASYSGYTIQWEEFVPGSGFQNLSSNVKVNFTVSTQARGYRLTLTAIDDTVISQAWFLKNEFSTEILTKDQDGNLSNGAYTALCESYGPIQVRINQTNLVYFDPQRPDTSLLLSPEYNKEWEKEFDVPQGEISDKGQAMGNFRYVIDNAYWKDMEYTFILSDGCGTERRDVVNVRSINPYANFTLKHIKLDDTTYYPGQSEEYYHFYSSENSKDKISAPAQYMFINESENAHEYLWSFGDSIKIRTTKDTVFHTYDYWGDFNVKLTAEHKVLWWNQTCTSDTTILADEDGVKISKPELPAPNYFSVNNASYLGTWRFQDVTITDFEIAIFARTGRRVHHFKGNIRDWDGWDGSVNNSNRKVSTGVYWYIVKDYTDLRNFDPNIKNENIWPDGENNDDGGSSSSSGSGKRASVKANEYRGFIHVFN